MPSEDQSNYSSVEEILKNAQAHLASITEAQKTANLAVNDITTAATQALAAKTQIADAQTVIATKSDHIQKAQEHADKVRADLDRALTSATQQSTEAEGLKARAQSATDSAANALADLQKTKASVEADVTAIISSRKSAEESTVVTQGLADKSAATEERVADYEKRLAEFEKQCAARLKDIEALLPGATAAGLASSWNERRVAFLKPHTGWQRLFVGSVLALVALAVSGLWHVYNAATPPTYDELVRLWLARLPVAGALVWLAIHASRESALAKRLEEDYGYKAAIASCLMGFQKQISEVGKDAAANPSLAKLLDDTLRTIAAPPGRIYDKHKLSVSPSSELTEVAKSVAEVTGVAKPKP